MTTLFPVYEVGSLPKLSARVNALRGTEVSKSDLQQLRYFAVRTGLDISPCLEIVSRVQREQRKCTAQEKETLIDLNSALNLKLQEYCGLDYVYDGEARRTEMYRHAAQQIEGFVDLPEMIRSRGPDSWRMAVCAAEPRLKSSLDTLPIVQEFSFVQQRAQRAVKIPLDDPYMIAVMSDNKYYTEKLREQYAGNPAQLRYEAKKEFTLALARNIIRPHVEAVVKRGAPWIQLDAPAATLDLEHIPILVAGLNAVVEGIDRVKFSVHFCYPRRVSLMAKSGYELLFPSLLDLHPNITHFSLELANADTYEQDLQPFAWQDRKFEIGVGVVDITLEQQYRGTLETKEVIRNRIVQAAEVLGDAHLVYVAPDCGLRQLSLERCEKIYDVMVAGAELARKG